MKIEITLDNGKTGTFIDSEGETTATFDSANHEDIIDAIEQLGDVSLTLEYLLMSIAVPSDRQKVVDLVTRIQLKHIEMLHDKEVANQIINPVKH